MPDFITPPVTPITDDDRAYLAENMPALVANPNLLQMVNDSVHWVGTTFEHIVQQICQEATQCQAATDFCFDGIVTGLEQRFNDAGIDGNTVLNAFRQDFEHLWGVCNQEAVQIINSCTQTIQEAVDSLETGCYAEITQNIPIPEPKGWNFVRPWNDWRFLPTSTYILDSNGLIAWGARLNEDYSIDYKGGSNTPNDIEPGNFNDELLIWSSNPINKPISDVCESYLPVDCMVPTDFGPGIISPPVVAPPVMPSPPPITPGGTGTVTTLKPGCCPPANIVVNVSPTPVTINVPPCPPAAKPVTPVVPPSIPTGSTTGTTDTTVEKDKQPTKGSPGTELLKWEPPVDDIAEQLLDAIDFPEDFIEWFGPLVHATVTSSVPENEDVSIDFEEGFQ